MGIKKERRILKLFRRLKKTKSFLILKLLIPVYWFVYLFRTIRDKLNKADFGTVLIIFFIVMFFAFLIINKIQVQATLIESETVDKTLAKWNGRYASLNFIAIIQMILFCWLLILQTRRPRKPQVFPQKR